MLQYWTWEHKVSKQTFKAIQLNYACCRIIYPQQRCTGIMIKLRSLLYSNSLHIFTYLGYLLLTTDDVTSMLLCNVISVNHTYSITIMLFIRYISHPFYIIIFLGNLINGKDKEMLLDVMFFFNDSSRAKQHWCYQGFFGPCDSKHFPMFISHKQLLSANQR